MKFCTLYLGAVSSCELSAKDVCHSLIHASLSQSEEDEVKEKYEEKNYNNNKKK